MNKTETNIPSLCVITGARRTDGSDYIQIVTNSNEVATIPEGYELFSSPMVAERAAKVRGIRRTRKGVEYLENGTYRTTKTGAWTKVTV